MRVIAVQVRGSGPSGRGVPTRSSAALADRTHANLTIPAPPENSASASRVKASRMALGFGHAEPQRLSIPAEPLHVPVCVERFCPFVYPGGRIAAGSIQMVLAQCRITRAMEAT